MALKKCRLDQWQVYFKKSDPYKAPEQAKMRLVGNVYGHPRFKDGTPVETSEIIEMDDKLSPRFVQTKFTEYELMTMDPAYKTWLENFRKNTQT